MVTLKGKSYRLRERGTRSTPNRRANPTELNKHNRRDSWTALP